MLPGGAHSGNRGTKASQSADPMSTSPPRPGRKWRQMAYSSPGAMNTESALSPEAVRAAPQPLAARPYHRVHPGHRVHDDHGGRTSHQLFIHANPGDFVMPIVPPPASATLIWAFPTEFEVVRSTSGNTARRAGASPSCSGTKRSRSKWRRHAGPWRPALIWSGADRCHRASESLRAIAKRWQQRQGGGGIGIKVRISGGRQCTRY
jgi:hypothetical protein